MKEGLFNNTTGPLNNWKFKSLLKILSLFNLKEGMFSCTNSPVSNYVVM